MLDGRYSKNTVVSKIRFPPPPNADRATNSPSTGQLGAAPAAIAKMEHMRSEVLKAVRRPMMSAVRPQKSAPIRRPMYKHIVSARLNDAFSSRAA